MRTKTAVRTGLVPVFLLAGAAMAAPAASADTPLNIDPNSVRPGDSVTISGWCGKNNDAVARVTSPALAPADADVDERGSFTVETTVSYVRPKVYTVIAKCNMTGQRGTARILVKKRKPPREPKGWAHTGGGGSQGPDVPWTPMGLVLVAGAAGIGGAALLRSRARGRA
ncbi:hypothetical protein [Spirillospora sp. CA-294931]|uniref:hypothetical protein n=1 Tax=Spirillospora sp. CA-294931 TaxID=3240042 RepID=UPI003D8F282C